MTADEFRRLALALSGAIEKGHQGHPDFRVNNKVFATVGYPDENFAMVKLTPDQQRECLRLHPKIFSPVKGAWGLQGSTHVRLAEADPETAGEAITAAWRNAQAAAEKKRYSSPRSRSS